MGIHLSARSKRVRQGEEGYALMILLLAMALMIIFTAAIVPTIKFEIEHDREEEMVHRGVQYSRAIRAYYKRFGRYPAKIEDLENTNNMRFLRKRYKDPMSCRQGQCDDFKLLHFGEVKLTFGGGMIPGMMPGGGGAAGGALGATGAGAMNTALLAGAAMAQMPTQQNPFAPSDSSQSSPANGNQNSDTSANPNGGSGSSTDSGNSDSGQPNLKGFSSQTFGGGPIVGVASTSKKQGYREFNHKKKYSEWQFVYDPGIDRGGLLTMPNQQPLMQQAQNVNGTQGNSGTNGTNPTGGFGMPNGVGTQGGFGGLSNQNNPTQPSPPLDTGNSQQQ